MHCARAAALTRAAPSRRPAPVGDVCPLRWIASSTGPGGGKGVTHHRLTSQPSKPLASITLRCGPARWRRGVLAFRSAARRRPSGYRISSHVIWARSATSRAQNAGGRPTWRLSQSVSSVNSKPSGYAVTAPAQTATPVARATITSPGTTTGMVPDGGQRRSGPVTARQFPGTARAPVTEPPPRESEPSRCFQRRLAPLPPAGRR
jgi:hypothetical protein